MTPNWILHRAAMTRVPRIDSNMLEYMMTTRYRNEKILEKLPVTNRIAVTTKVSIRI